MDKRRLAKQYYEELMQLENSRDEITKRLSEKLKRIDKDRFIEDYPLSALGVINYRTFWEICFEVGIVHNPFYCDYEELNPFEQKLHNIINSLIHMPNNNEYTKDDIISLFRKYKFTS
ncbi:hypothetical protein [Sporosalibacterium faouarense]|uniref:hypothetical protein n=1 Tax=Sporosalibacterium faouarense TaxID=516123 RepID=UPI00141CB4BE|nr:hypothetical protein [Sporosalibacterium faouarense]MTI49174.1 hypothetical protein [Bacillota bacterium]